jgi:hypothetical protein
VPVGSNSKVGRGINSYLIILTSKNNDNNNKQKRKERGEGGMRTINFLIAIFLFHEGEGERDRVT